jgi:deazaflavin-dependent oxidoreductase (nitroreductase family)
VQSNTDSPGMNTRHDVIILGGGAPGEHVSNSSCAGQADRLTIQPFPSFSQIRASALRSAFVTRLQKSVINPLDKLAFALRIPPPGDALLETTGRRTGRPRVTPVCDGLEGDTFWIVAQRGRAADYVRNIAADPRVRVKGSLSRGGWRAGTAHILDADDAQERVRSLSRGNRWRRLCLQASGAVGTRPLTVRIDLDPVAG